MKGDSTGGRGHADGSLAEQYQPARRSESHVKFTLQSKKEIYTTFDNALFRDPGDPLRFSYPADHPLASEFEEQMTALIREYKGDGEYLSPPSSGRAGSEGRRTGLNRPDTACGGRRRDWRYFILMTAGHMTKEDQRKARQKVLDKLSIEELGDIKPYKQGRIGALKVDKAERQKLSKTEMIETILQHEGLGTATK